MIFKQKIYKILCLVIFALPFLSFAQQKPPKNTYKFDELILLLEKKYDVVFSFDAGLIKDVPIFVDTTKKSISAMLENLNLKRAFLFQKVDKKNIIIKPKSITGNFVLSGFIMDGKTHEPLYSAVIYSKKSKFNTSCKEDGSFYKIIKYDADDTISIFLAGYENISIPIKNFAENESVGIYMKNTLRELKEISITAYMSSGIEYDAMDNSITIRPKNRSILPGQINGDILLSLDALPGISTPDSKAGSLNIRGSTPDQTLIMFDNIPLYQKGHILGTISPFNANVVDNIKIQRSSMSANKGGRVGGIIEISSPSSVVNKPSVTVSTSLLDANIYAHIPIIKNKLSFFVSARYSYPYSWGLPPMKTISNFIFQNSEVSGAMKNDLQGISKLNVGYDDVNAKLIYNLTAKQKATVSGLYNTDNIAINLRDPKQLLYSNSTMNMKNYGANAMLTSNWNKAFSSQLSATNSYYTQNYQTDKISYSNAPLTNSTYKNTVQDLQLFFETQWRISDKHILKTGYNINYYNTDYIRTSNDTTNVSLKQNFGRTGSVNTLYANWLASPINNLTIDAGVRLNYYTGNSKISAEPRLMLGYKCSPNFRLKASGGYQKQFISQVSGISIQSIGGIQSQLWMLTDDKNVPIVNSYQGTFGGLYEKKSWLIDVEGYVKQVENVSNISITQPLSAQPFIHGNINIIGVDVLVRKQWKKLDCWVSYTLSKAMMQFDSVQKNAFYSLYDQTHVLDIATSYKIKQFKFSLAWKYRTGFAILPGIRTKMLAGADSAPKATQQGQGSQPPPPPPANNDNDRFPAYHQLDASVQYSFPKIPKGWNGFIGLSVLNCYDQKNIMNQSYILNNGVKTLRNQYMMGRMLNIVLSFSF
jgi:hypothetical protein